MAARAGADAPLYVETLVRAPLERVWDLTQDPDLHARWDLRFSSIRHLPRPDPAAPQEFRYAVRPLPGLEITGTGRSLGERSRPDGTRTSALGWERDGVLSPVGTGRGYWRYVPVRTPRGPAVRFLTGYDYRPGWGEGLDRIVRPALGWATAWSFDRLRLWAEHDQTPERSRTYGLLDLGARAAGVAAVAALTRRAPGSIRAAAVVVATVLVVASPAPAAVPRASRCRRAAVDSRARPPSTMRSVVR